jgi:hypothetical protein
LTNGKKYGKIITVIKRDKRKELKK